MFRAEVNTAIRNIHVELMLLGMNINRRYIMIFMCGQQLGERKDV